MYNAELFRGQYLINKLDIIIDNTREQQIYKIATGYLWIVELQNKLIIWNFELIWNTFALLCKLFCVALVLMHVCIIVLASVV